MNFLAHIFLSGTNEQIIIGNFIGDWIKGNDFKNYPQDVQKGIIIHRSIDSFTDSHPLVRQSKSRLNDQYHKYSGIIIDIFYDHFLAYNWEKYSSVALLDFTRDLNQILTSNIEILTPDMQEFFPRFMKRKWMETYGTIEGIENVLNGMSRHTSLPDKTIDAIRILKINYDSFRDEFFEFFPLIIEHIENTFQIPILENLPNNV